MNFFSPLEQFEISPFFSLFTSGGWDFSLTNAAVYITFVSLLVALFVFFTTYQTTSVPNNWQLLGENIYKFSVSVLRQQAGPSSEPYFPLLYAIFLFVLFANLLGLVPFSFAVTGQISVTLTLALSFNLGLMILGYSLHGNDFFKLFIPSGVPTPAVPLIVVIEVVSYLLRTFSLSVRLFANIMAGHTLLHILTSFSVAFLSFNFYVLALLPYVLVLAITFLELGIAFLQAYVFLVLMAIYLNDSLHPVHLFKLSPACFILVLWVP